MQYRKFGNTGIEISTLGFGCMRLPHHNNAKGEWVIDQDKVDEMLKYAYENGVNYFDTAPTYCNSASEQSIGKALKGFRDKIYISTKCGIDDSIKDAGEYRRRLEESLKKLDTDYVDFYHFWGINRGTVDYHIKPKKLIEEALKMKEEGLIRHISFSFHDSNDAMKYIIDQCPHINFIGDGLRDALDPRMRRE